MSLLKAGPEPRCSVQATVSLRVTWRPWTHIGRDVSGDGVTAGPVLLGSDPTVLGCGPWPRKAQLSIGYSHLGHS